MPDEQLSCSGEQVSEIIRTAPCEASLKDSQTGKCIHVSTRFAEVLGAKDEKELLGLTLEDFYIYKCDFGSSSFSEWKKDDIKYLEELDNEIRVTGTYLTTKQNIHFTHRVLFLTATS